MSSPPWRGARAGSPRFFLLTLAVLLASGACRGLGGPEVAPLAHTHESPEALARAVLDAVAARDAEALRRLALTEQEFADHVWPGLPAARPERNLPRSYVWGDLRQKSESYLALTLHDLGGRRLSLLRLSFAGETTDHGTYKVHRKSLLRVRDQEGAERELRVFGSVLEQGGRFKVFSYVVD